MEPKVFNWEHFPSSCQWKAQLKTIYFQHKFTLHLALCFSLCFRQLDAQLLQGKVLAWGCQKQFYLFPCFSVAQRIDLAGCFQREQPSLFYAKATFSDPVCNNLLQKAKPAAGRECSQPAWEALPQGRHSSPSASLGGTCVQIKGSLMHVWGKKKETTWLTEYSMERSFFPGRKEEKGKNSTFWHTRFLVTPLPVPPFLKAP